MSGFFRDLLQLCVEAFPVKKVGLGRCGGVDLVADPTEVAAVPNKFNWSVRRLAKRVVANK
eukprot:12935873-Prorocentrum_lima.AAC.1